MMKGDQQPWWRQRSITVWLMKDKTAEPIQYQLEVRKILALGAGLLCFAIFVPLALAVTSIKYQSLKKENRELSRIASLYQVSEEKLQQLSESVSRAEKRLSGTCQRTLSVISGMERDLSRWMPDGAAGGPDGEEGNQEAVSDSDMPPLSPSQIKQVNSIQARLDRLSEQVESYDDTISELEGTWEERNSIFHAFPSLWPIGDEGRITSSFGMRIHPISRKLQMHEGLDIAAPRGKPVYASAPGIVTWAGRKSGYGKSVGVDHGYNLSTFYAHCDSILVSPGQRVKKGQKIATVGSTGYATGPHLHFEVRVKEIPVDPLQYLNVFSPGPEEE